MKKTIVILLIVILLIVAAVYFIFGKKFSDDVNIKKQEASFKGPLELPHLGDPQTNSPPK